MPALALTYSVEDQDAARRMEADLDGFVDVVRYPIEPGLGRPLLASVLDSYEGAVVVLVSDYFLRNENCLYGCVDFLTKRGDVLPVMVSSRSYDPELEEVVSRIPDLAEPDTIDAYVHHWEERLTELTSGEPAQAGTSTPKLRNYVERVRQVSEEMPRLLDEIGEQTLPTDASLIAEDYEEIFMTLRDESGFARYLADRNAQFMQLPGVSALPDEPADHLELPDLELPELESDDETAPADTAGAEADQEAAAYHIDAEAQAEQWINQAWDLYEAGNGEAGLELLGNGKERLPDYPDVAYNYALMLAMDSAAPRVALMELEKLLDEFHDHAGALFLSGELSALVGDYEAANLDWLQLKDVDPLYPKLNYRLGVLISEHFPERLEEAVTYLRKAARDEPPNGDARYRYGMLLFHQTGSTKKAVKWIKRAIDVDPNHATAHYALATLLYRRGKLGPARAAFRKAVELNPAYDTEINRAAFTHRTVPSFAAPEESSGYTRRLQDRIAALEARLAERGDPAPSSPRPAPASAQKKAENEQRTVFISGATSGIGRATADLLARHGYRLILLGRREARLQELQTRYAERFGIDVRTITADVRDREALREALDALPAEWKRVDVLLNNAGKAKGFDPIHEGDYAHWDEMIDVNLKGLLTLTREVTPWMVRRGTGTIINVCSTAGKEVYPNGNVYCATKHAVDALTYAMRLDLVKHGIRVGQICPAHVEETEFAVVRFDGDRERAKIYEDFQPLRSSDVAEAIHFMLRQPPHVNIMDVVLQGTQQASSTVVDRSGREKFRPTTNPSAE